MVVLKIGLLSETVRGNLCSGRTNVLLKEEKRPELSLASSYEETEGRQPSATRKKSYQKLKLPEYASWTSPTQP